MSDALERDRVRVGIGHVVLQLLDAHGRAEHRDVAALAPQVDGGHARRNLVPFTGGARDADAWPTRRDELFGGVPQRGEGGVHHGGDGEDVVHRDVARFPPPSDLALDRTEHAFDGDAHRFGIAERELDGLGNLTEGRVA